IYLFIFYRINLEGAWSSVQSITHEQWYAGGIMRSLHRYSSDAAMLLLGLHLVRELLRGRYTGARWFSWLTGMPLVWIIVVFGISGYWMVWDQLAAWVATASGELLDVLPIFTDPMSRNFISNETVSGRLFTLIGFIHLVGLPVVLVLAIWFHLLRVRYPRINPPRSLMIGSLAALLVLSVISPAVSHAPADLARVPGELAIDWFYLAIFPLQTITSPTAVWGLTAGGTLVLAALPWIFPRRGRQPVAEVHLPDCTGCGFCASDCPYGAIDMVPRSDGRNFALEAHVNASLCVSCGICTGACPSSSPYRRRDPLTTGIEMPHFTMDDFRRELDRARQSGRTDGKVLVFGCDHGVSAEEAAGNAHVMTLPCVGFLPPAGIDYALRNTGYAGVAIAGCAECDCHHRLGDRWLAERIDRERQPHLRQRVSRERILTRWLKPGQERELAAALSEFAERVGNIEKEPFTEPKRRRTGT
ncbi:MAG: cytochrome b N-terminal domain-containing protein, partial [Wenzhouxiangella sp.]